MKSRVGFIAGMLLSAGLCQAAPVITFEALTTVNNVNFNFVPGNFTYVEAGFHFSTTLNSGLLFPGTNADLYALAGNSTAIQFNAFSDIGVMQAAISGNAFSVASLDVSETCLVCGPQAVTLFGNFAGGGSVTQGFVMDNLAGAQTVNLLGFENVTDFRWFAGNNNSRAQIDNIVLAPTAVPEPATAVLLLAGLAALGAATRYSSGSGRRT